MAGTAVVTGASSGIGRATAQRLAADGFDVVLAARREERLRELAAETGGRPVRLDVTDDASVAGLAAAVERCDVLVNVAGGAFGVDPVESGTVADWQRMYEVNVLGTLRVTQALLPALAADGGGTVVNLTSTAATVNYEGGGGYSAAKHAEHALTETLRLELAGRPVRVVEIAPGMVRTDEFSTDPLRRGRRARRGRLRGRRPAADGGRRRRRASRSPSSCRCTSTSTCLTVRPLAQAAQHKVFRGTAVRRGCWSERRTRRPHERVLALQSRGRSRAAGGRRVAQHAREVQPHDRQAGQARGPRTRGSGSAAGARRRAAGRGRAAGAGRAARSPGAAPAAARCSASSSAHGIGGAV